MIYIDMVQYKDFWGSCLSKLEIVSSMWSRTQFQTYPKFDNFIESRVTQLLHNLLNKAEQQCS